MSEKLRPWACISTPHSNEYYTYTENATYSVVFTGNPETASCKLMIYQYSDHTEKLIHKSWHYPVSAAMEYAEKLAVTSNDE